MRSHCGAGLFFIKAAYDARRHRTQPSHGGKHRIRRCALPRYPAYCLDTCPALCRSMCYPLRRSPLWTNFPPPLLRRPASSKRGPRESSDELKAKYLLAPVMMEAAAAQRFTFSTTSSSSRSLSLLCSAVLQLLARSYRLRLQLRMPYCSLCVVRIQGVGTGLSRSQRGLRGVCRIRQNQKRARMQCRSGGGSGMQRLMMIKQHNDNT